MRNRWGLQAGVVLALALVTGAGWAQNAKAIALSEDIHRYELMVQKPPSQQDGAAWCDLAKLYQDAARYEDAEHAYTKAIALFTTGDRTRLANAMDGMGTMYVETGRYAQAQPLESKALAIREEQNDSVGVGRSWMHLAMLSLGERNLADAERYSEMATERLVPEHFGHQASTAATPEEKMTALIYLSLARCARGSCTAGIAELKAAHDLAEASYDAQSFPVAYTNFLLGYESWKSGDTQLAGELMKRGSAGMEEQLGWRHPTLISAMTQYEAFLRLTRHNDEAAEIGAKIAQAQASRRPSMEVGSEAMLHPSVQPAATRTPSAP
jgi:tetratricopeptide (TPR) repeat protein